MNYRCHNCIKNVVNMDVLKVNKVKIQNRNVLHFTVAV
jgi:hypothetical protein